MEFVAARKRGRPAAALNGNGGFKKSKQEMESFSTGIGSKSKPCTKFFRLDDLVNDAYEMFTSEAGPLTPNCVRLDEGYIASEFSNDPHTHKGKKYERLHRLAVEPLHPPTGTSRRTIMYALVKLNDLKTQFSLSDGATCGILPLLNELFLEGNNLTISYSEMKNTIRDFGSTYVKYDVCINNCMSFWKENESRQECLKCGAKRYKLTSRDDENNGVKFVQILFILAYV